MMTGIDAARDIDNSFGYFNRYSHAAIDDTIIVIEAAIEEDPLHPSVVQHVVSLLIPKTFVLDSIQ